MEFIRQVDRSQFTPVITLKKGEQCVVVIGLIHIATELYFRNTLKRIEQYEVRGYVVLHEVLVDEITFSNPKSQRIAQEISDLIRRMKEPFLTFHGLKYQTDYLTVRPGWISADFSEREMQQLFLDIGLDDSRLESARQVFGKALANPRKVVRQITESVVNFHGNLEKIGAPNKRPSSFLEQAVDQRDRRAVEVIVHHVQSRPVVTFWGCAHLPGIVGQLEALGFHTVSTEWVHAVSYLPIPPSE